MLTVQRKLPSRHKTSKQRRIDVDVMTSHRRSLKASAALLLYLNWTLDFMCVFVCVSYCALTAESSVSFGF